MVVRQYSICVYRLMIFIFSINFGFTNDHGFIQKARYLVSMLFQLWTSILEGEPALKQHWVELSRVCWLGT